MYVHMYVCMYVCIFNPTLEVRSCKILQCDHCVSSSLKIFRLPALSGAAALRITAVGEGGGGLRDSSWFWV